MTIPSSLDPWGQGRFALPPDRLRPTPSESDPPPPAPAHESRGVEFFHSVEHFVNDYIAPVVCRRLGQGTGMWCPEWWRHPEAVVRFAGLWRAFEYFAKDPDTGISTWWLHHADPHLRSLLDPDFGPFALCDPEDGHARHPLGPLPVRPAPDQTWENPLFQVVERDTEGG